MRSVPTPQALREMTEHDRIEHFALAALRHFRETGVADEDVVGLCRRRDDVGVRAAIRTATWSAHMFVAVDYGAVKARVIELVRQ